MKFECPNCGQHLAIETMHQGVGVDCPACGKSLTVPDKPSEEVTIQQIETIWDSSVRTGKEPDMTLKTKTSTRARQEHGTISDRLALRSQSVAEEGKETAPPPHYELVGRLGEGGMGIVYRARQTSTDRMIALKVIKPQYQQEKDHKNGFLCEAVATADLEHPNIVPVYDVGSNKEGALFYAMKEVKGTSWKDVIDDKYINENLDILMRVADAIAFAHSRGVIHRDLKPENVMLGDFGEVLVMDWGLAAAVTDEAKADRLDEDYAIGGTPCYMAPEMAVGDADKIGPLSDVYLLGAILYEIVTGKKPHAGSSVTESLVNASNNIIQDTDQEGELVDVARKAMATEPEDRYEGVKKFQAAIHEYQKHEQSIVLVAAAEKNLKRAGEKSSYEDYARALFGFAEALEMWGGNHEARKGQTAAALAYAECAYEKGDYDLALSLLDEKVESHIELGQKVQAAADERRARVKRIRLLRVATVTLMAIVIVGLTVGFLWIRKEQEKTKAALVQVEKEKKQTQEALQQVEKQKKKAEAYASRSSAVSGFLIEMLGKADPKTSGGKDVTVLQVMDAMSKAVAPRFGKDEIMRMNIQSAIGRVFTSLGRYEDALVHLEDSLHIAEKLYGEDSEEYAKSLSDLAGLYYETQPDKAEPLFRQVLEANKKLYGEDSHQYGSRTVPKIRPRNKPH